jgi:hypothetical protein
MPQNGAIAITNISSDFSVGVVNIPTDARPLCIKEVVLKIFDR